MVYIGVGVWAFRSEQGLGAQPPAGFAFVTHNGVTVTYQGAAVIAPI